MLEEFQPILGSRQGDDVIRLGKGNLPYLKGAQLLRLQSLYAPTIPFIKTP